MTAVLGFFCVLCASVESMRATAVKYAVETGKRVSVKLDWNSADVATYYRVFQRKGDDEWRSISTFDDASPNRVIKVLNAFPVLESTLYFVHKSQFVYFDGTTAQVETSSSLKVWMEGGKINGTTVTPHGKNATTGELFIRVDIIPSDDLDLNPSLIWDYDVVAFGSWDGSGSDVGLTTSAFPTRNFPKTQLINELTEYLSLGYSVIASHDTIGFFSGATVGLGQIRSKFGIKVGGRGSQDTNVDRDSKGVLMQNNWAIWGTQAEIVKSGHIVDFPWRITGKYIPTKLVHTYGNIATSDVWLRIVADTSQRDHKDFQYTVTEKEDFTYYLTTKNNTAMIQTGHQKCAATDEEKKLWANLIVSMKQRTESTSVIDHSCLDEERPLAPVCDCSVRDGQYSFDCTAEDTDTTYQYRVEGYDETGTLVAESALTANATSGIDYFVYHVDTDTSMTKDELLTKTTKVNYSEQITGMYNMNLYLHVLAVDKSGNPSDVTNHHVFKCVTTALFDVSRPPPPRLHLFIMHFLYTYDITSINGM